MLFTWLSYKPIQFLISMSLFIIVKYYFIHVSLLKYPLQEYRDVSSLMRYVMMTYIPSVTLFLPHFYRTSRSLFLFYIFLYDKERQIFSICHFLQTYLTLQIVYNSDFVCHKGGGTHKVFWLILKERSALGWGVASSPL